MCTKLSYLLFWSNWSGVFKTLMQFFLLTQNEREGTSTNQVTSFSLNFVRHFFIACISHIFTFRGWFCLKNIVCSIVTFYAWFYLEFEQKYSDCRITYQHGILMLLYLHKKHLIIQTEVVCLGLTHFWLIFKWL